MNQKICDNPKCDEIHHIKNKFCFICRAYRGFPTIITKEGKSKKEIKNAS